ncbi:6-phospho-beta-glucosidase [Mobilicoccus caccae]|nr:6-phospho-beta-glucosidase [Mobilicoccus caccae]
MKLALLGGGGFRVPLVYGALLSDVHDRRVDEIALHDVDPGRLAAISHVLTQMAAQSPREVEPPRVVTTTDLDVALTGADFVFSAIRVGGLAGRTCDERVALDLGLLGQETTGPGGLAYGLRTVPVAREIARRVAAVAPGAFVIDFTNPAGLITQAMNAEIPGRVVGICDSPIALIRRVARALEVDPARVSADYVGLNHLGWLRGMRVDGVDLLPDLLARPDLVESFEEGKLFGAEWLQTIGAVPNEYLYYYDFTREAIASIRGGAQTRGEFLLDQQTDFYRAVEADPDSALATWRAAREHRDATYMKEAREEGEERDALDVAGGGYEGVALALMAAIARGERSTMILDVPGGTAVPGLPADAVVEVPCLVDASGVSPLATRPLTGRMLGLVQQVKYVETLVIEAALERDPRLAVEAFASHPLVDSVTTARALFDGYCARIPELGSLFRR